MKLTLEKIKKLIKEVLKEEKVPQEVKGEDLRSDEER